MKSNYALLLFCQTYEEAQNKIDDDKDQEALTQGLRRLLKLSKIMKQKRVDSGALQLASSEVRYFQSQLEPFTEKITISWLVRWDFVWTWIKDEVFSRFTVDSETADPIDVQTKQIRETNSMVEEFMLVSSSFIKKYYAYDLNSHKHYTIDRNLRVTPEVWIINDEIFLLSFINSTTSITSTTLSLNQKLT